MNLHFLKSTGSLSFFLAKKYSISFCFLTNDLKAVALGNSKKNNEKKEKKKKLKEKENKKKEQIYM